MKQDFDSGPQSTRVFVTGLVVGSTLGAVALALTLAGQGAKFHSVNTGIGGALLLGLLSAMSARACSRGGRNSPARTALWAMVGSLSVILMLALRDLVRDGTVSNKVIVFELALGVVLTVCSSLAVWLSQKQNNAEAQQPPHLT